jgi:ATP diphosphatase
MARLRDKDTGCPWDLEQDFSTIAPYTIEEAYEVADAIARDDLDDLRGELGDLLLQVVFHARMAEEAGHFDFDDVARTINDKMIRRHPHVFGDVDARDAGAVSASWEQIKAEERAGNGDSSTLAGIALALPALKRAEKLARRAATVGFDWPDPTGPLAKIHEELDELGRAAQEGDSHAVAEEVGDLLFAAASLARHHKVDPEAALGAANAKFERRFRMLEALVEESGERVEDLSLDALESVWQTVKSRSA